jgi:hypothetical protein
MVLIGLNFGERDIKRAGRITGIEAGKSGGVAKIHRIGYFDECCLAITVDITGFSREDSLGVVQPAA